MSTQAELRPAKQEGRQPKGAKPVRTGEPPAALVHAAEIVWNLENYMDRLIRLQERANPVHVAGQLAALSSLLEQADDRIRR